MVRFFAFRQLFGTMCGLLAAMVLVGSSGLAFAQDEPAPDVTTDAVTILLMGADKRPDDQIDAVRSDIMAVLHLDPVEKSCRLLSIPRDTRIELPGIGSTKINHALMAGGVPLARETVEGFLGVEIDHYGLIDFEGAATVIDALGGVTITNETDFSVGSNHFPAGEQRLDGARAVLFARYRGGPDGDFGRMQRQQQVFQALIRELDGAEMQSILQAAWTGLGGHVMTDLTPEALLTLADTYAGACTSSTLGVDTIPDSSQGFAWDDLFGQELWFVMVDPAVVQEKVHWLLTGE